MGYLNVRDIGGFDAARSVLDKEQVGRQLDKEMEEMGVLGPEKTELEGKEGEGEGKKHKRAQSFGKLMEGLKELED